MENCCIIIGLECRKGRAQWWYLWCIIFCYSIGQKFASIVPTIQINIDIKCILIETKLMLEHNFAPFEYLLRFRTNVGCETEDNEFYNQQYIIAWVIGMHSVILYSSKDTTETLLQLSMDDVLLTLVLAKQKYLKKKRRYSEVFHAVSFSYPLCKRPFLFPIISIAWSHT